MSYIHFSKTPFKFDRYYKYPRNTKSFKPEGLHFSLEEFFISDFDQITHEEKPANVLKEIADYHYGAYITLYSTERLLHIRSMNSFTNFIKRYSLPYQEGPLVVSKIKAIDWGRVAEDYDGFVFETDFPGYDVFPFHEDFGPLEGVIWNLSIIDNVHTYIPKDKLEFMQDMAEVLPHIINYALEDNDSDSNDEEPCEDSCEDIMRHAPDCDSCEAKDSCSLYPTVQAFKFIIKDGGFIPPISTSSDNTNNKPSSDASDLPNDGPVIK